MKNLFFKLLFIFVCMLTISPFAGAAIKYGEAVIKNGNVVVVRSGRFFLYTPANNPVTIYENDTIRTMKGSALTLFNPDQNRVTLGANAIMQIKKWRKKSNQGAIRMLFGKFRARTASVRKRSLNIRTATATIGIKGSLAEGNTSSNHSMISNRGGSMFMENDRGEILDIEPGQYMFNVDDQNQEFQVEQDLGFDPNKSEDDQESTGLEQLDTTESKTPEVPPVVQIKVEQNIVEVTQTEVDTTPTTEPEGSPDEILDEILDKVDEAADDASGINPTIKVNIEVEN